MTMMACPINMIHAPVTGIYNKVRLGVIRTRFMIGLLMVNLGSSGCVLLVPPLSSSLNTITEELEDTVWVNASASPGDGDLSVVTSEPVGLKEVPTVLNIEPDAPKEPSDLPATEATEKSESELENELDPIAEGDSALVTSLSGLSTIGAEENVSEDVLTNLNDLRKRVDGKVYELVRLLDLRAITKETRDVVESTEPSQDQGGTVVSNEPAADKSEVQEESVGFPTYIFAPGKQTPESFSFYSMGYVLKHGRMSFCLLKMERYIHSSRTLFGETDNPLAWFYRHRLVTCTDEVISFDEGGPLWVGCGKIESVLSEVEQEQKNRIDTFRGGNILHFLRHLYPLYFSDFHPNGTIKMRHERILKHIQSTAYQKIEDASSLIYGDLLVRKDSGFLVVGIYLGHGVVGSFNAQGVQYASLKSGYEGAYRLIPAFGMCSYQPREGEFLQSMESWN